MKAGNGFTFLYIVHFLYENVIYDEVAVVARHTRKIMKNAF